MMATMFSPNVRGCGAWVLALILANVSFADNVPSSSLSLDEAISLAKARNGQALAAVAQLEAAKANKNIAAAGFLPTLTPRYQYSTGRTNLYTGVGGGSQRLNTRSATADITASWRLWDSGARSLNLKIASRSLDSEQFSALDTVRGVLFAVERDFYEALRAQELLLVQEAQAARAKTILEQTELRVEVGDSAKKDILQAKADFLNSEVAKLTSQARTYTTKATLKATVGWDEKSLFPALAPVEKSWDTTELPPLQDVIAKGLATRPDLSSQRKQVEGSRFNVRLAELDAGVQMSLDATANRTFGDDVSNRGQLVFEATIPLFDGRRSKEAVRARRATLMAAEARYGQSERDARSEIESAYTDLVQARLRMSVADAAYEAARVNYDAAIEAQRLGAGTLLEVLTAQVSLVTAESNRVETFFDLRIAESRLKLVTGQPLRGE